MAQRLSNTEAKITGVRIHKPWTDSSIASVTMNQDKFAFAHLPSLLQDLGECPVEHDFSRMIAVKINLHPLRPGQHEFRPRDNVNAISSVQCLAYHSRLRGVVVRTPDIFP